MSQDDTFRIWIAVCEGLIIVWNIGVLWLMLGDLLRLDRLSRIGRDIYHELKWPTGVAVFGRAVLQLLVEDFSSVAFFMNLLNWVAQMWFFRNDKDDRWKRRRGKVAETIRRVGSRLVVAPRPA